jgi:hypothetical protein
MDQLQRAMTAPAAIQREADAAGVGRISRADRQAGNAVGELLTAFVWNGMPAPAYDPSGAEIALEVAAQVRATGSGFAVALAEWLEKWARKQK